MAKKRRKHRGKKYKAKKNKQDAQFHIKDGPGRMLKFQPGELAIHKDHGLVVIVAYRYYEPAQRGQYRSIRLLSLYPFKRVGPATWAETWNLTKLSEDSVPPVQPLSWKSVRVYETNKRLGETAAERGCSCQCCIHTAVSVSSVRADGSFTWEGDEDE